MKRVMLAGRNVTVTITAKGDALATTEALRFMAKETLGVIERTPHIGTVRSRIVVSDIEEADEPVAAPDEAVDPENERLHRIETFLGTLPAPEGTLFGGMHRLPSATGATTLLAFVMENRIPQPDSDEPETVVASFEIPEELGLGPEGATKLGELFDSAAQAVLDSVALRNRPADTPSSVESGELSGPQVPEGPENTTPGGPEGTDGEQG